MTTALCLYGHFRCFDSCKQELIDYLIKPNNINQIFIMGWTDSWGHFQHPILASNPKDHAGFDPASLSVDSTWLTDLLSLLQPCRVHFDNYHIHNDFFASLVNQYKQFHHPDINHRPKGTLSQVWARSTVLKLLGEYEYKNQMIFDRIVCTRWDIGYTKPIDLDTLDINTVTMDGMYGPEVISDAWACGPSQYMKSWGLQFDSLATLASKNTLSLGPHEWLKAHFEHCSINWTNQPDIGIWIRR